MNCGFCVYRGHVWSIWCAVGLVVMLGCGDVSPVKTAPETDVSKAATFEAVGFGPLQAELLASMMGFPDFFSNLIAQFFGIKSNINAIIFFCLGLIFFFQYKLFFMFKKQEEAMNKLARDKAIEPAFKNHLS